jgi:sugar phosphate isomerase/epimerase
LIGFVKVLFARVATRKKIGLFQEETSVVKTNCHPAKEEPIMQYGAMNFPILPVLEEIRTVAEMGFDYLELTLDPPEAHHSKIVEQEKEILAALSHHGLGLICHLPTFLYLADLAPRLREASRLEMKDALHAAAALHPQKVVLHPPHIGGLGSLVMDRSKRLAMESLAAVLSEADRLGLCVCIENMFPKYPGWIDPKDFAPVLETFPSLKMTLDFGHAHVEDKRGDRILAFLEAFKDRIGHIHISDNLGKADDHLPVGAGTIDFKKAARALKKTGYEDTVTLEIFSRDRDYLKISKEKMIRFFRDSIQF